MKLLSTIPKSELAGHVVLLRAGLNVPLDAAGNVADDTRIKQVLPTIKYLAKHCKKLVIITHIGRDKTKSLAPVHSVLMRSLQEDIHNHAHIEILENLRQDKREASADESERDAFAHDLIAHVGATLFVQDAFSVLHRNHASITSIPKFLPSLAGFVVEQEVSELGKARIPKSPSLFVLGGAKFATKEPLIRKFLSVYDKVFIGGALANEFFESLGLEVGESLVSVGTAVPDDILHHPKIILPKKVIVIDSKTNKKSTISPQELTHTMSIMDALPPSDLLSAPSAKFVLWNGPLGYYEGGFTQGTSELLELFNNSDTKIVTGGGDTLATVSAEQRALFAHISSGGGAMLTYLEEGTLVGLTSLG